MEFHLPTLLDVAIGLIFIFFVFSVFVSGIVELINTLLDQRAKLLKMALGKLLGDQLTTAFYEHNLTSIKQHRWFLFKRPINYLSANSFSTVFIDLVLANSQLPPDLTTMDASQTYSILQANVTNPVLKDVKALLEATLAKSSDFQTFKEELEKWYNGYMEQVSGWYKRNTQLVIGLTSLLVAFLLNVDTIFLTQRLFQNDGLRQQLVDEAIKVTQQGSNALSKTDTAFVSFLERGHKNLVDTTITPQAVQDSLALSDQLIVQAAYTQFLQGRIDELQLPIGWSKITGWQFWHWQRQPAQSGWLAILGCLLTAAALSFGAPFWFDLLLKVVNIRNTNRRPAGNPDPA